MKPQVGSMIEIKRIDTDTWYPAIVTGTVDNVSKGLHLSCVVFNADDEDGDVVTTAYINDAKAEVGVNWRWPSPKVENFD